MSKPAQPARASNPAEAAGMVDYVDERGVPVSTGIPPIVRISAIVGLVLILTVGGLVIFASAYGHVWPLPDSLKYPLTGH